MVRVRAARLLPTAGRSASPYSKATFVYKTLMAKSTGKKRIGRPPTGAGSTIAIRIPTQAIEAIDKRAKEQKTTRTAIARQLLMQALGLKQKP
jgi:hypothetical protein